MFTGLIEDIGIIQTVIKSAKSARITILADHILKGVKLGDSISTNGVCLTVTEFTVNRFTVDVMAETMRISNLHKLAPGDQVNLERALKIGDRLDGHMVSGHIDGMGVISKYEKEDNAVWVTVSTSEKILKYIIYKGSIAIDGVSLTVAYVDDKEFRVSIIPHTKELTTLIKKKVGDMVNLECDMISKYIEKILVYRDDKKVEVEESSGRLNLDFLAEHGFM
jgi:riboflavin synthase